MSTLSSISGHLGREQQLLRELNTSLIALEAEALGRTGDFGFSDEDISKSRQKFLSFTSRLLKELNGESSSVDMQSLVHRIKSGMKPLEDWREDLDDLVKQLQSEGKLQDTVLPTLEDVLSLLDSEFTEDLKRLYMR